MNTVNPVPALVAAARRRLLARFRDAGAIRPDAAIPIEGMRLIERRQFERMRKAGVIRDAEDGRYWMDEPSASAWVASRSRRVMIAAGTVAAGLLAFRLSRR